VLLLLATEQHVILLVRKSSILRRINQRNRYEIVYELKGWVRGGGKVLPGLVKKKC